MYKIVLSKVDKIILSIVLGAVPAGLLIVLITGLFFGPSLRQEMTERYLSDSVNGVVIRLYNDKEEHNVRTAVLKNNQIFQLVGGWEPYVEVGDSLFKKRGTFLLEIHKKQGKNIILDYKNELPSE